MGPYVYLLPAMRQAVRKQKEGSNVDKFVSQLVNQSKQTQVLKKEDY
jgi:hypothetical protein